MASTWSNLGLNLQGTGDNSGTWGQLTNVNLQDIDAAISGVYAITVTGNTTLAFTTNSSATTYTDEVGRNKIIILNGSLSATTITITTPNIEKDYIIINNSGATATISAGGSTTVSIATATKAYIYVDGASAVNFALPQAVSGLSIGGTTNAIQYNNAGALAGSTNLTFNGTTLAMQTATALNLTATSLTATNATITTDNITTANITTANVTTANVTSLTAVTATATTLNSTTINVTGNGTLKIYNTANSFYTGLQVAAGATTTATFTLPSADGTNGQVLQTNGSGQLSFATASGGASSLKSSITLKTAASITAGKLASINSSGQIVNLPTLNTYGTARTNSSSTFGSSYTCTSLDGSTALSVVNSYISPTMTATFYGSVISNSGTPTNGTTTTNTISTGGAYGSFSSMNTSILPIGNNTFMVMQYLNGNDGRACLSGTAFYASYFIITVDASTGNVTKGAVVTNNQTDGSSFGVSYFYAAQVNKNILINYAAASTLVKNLIITWSGTTVTATTDTTDVPFWYQATGFNSLLTSSNILCLGVPSSATWRTASWTASPPNIGTKTDTTAVADYYDSGAWWKMDATDATGASYVLFTYRNTSLNYVYNTFSINQTTGALTSVETGNSLTKLGSNTFSFSTFKNSSNQVYSNGSNVNSVSWTNGVVNGFNAAGYSTIPSSPIRYNSSDLYYLFYTNTSNYAVNQGYTVNAYSTDNFNYIGVVETTTSTSPASIVTDGVAANFTSLTPGTVYYATSPYDGTVTTSTASGILVGKAISSTQILLQRSNTQ
jgi:hypothetical protein